MALDGTPIIVKRVKAHAHAHHGGSWKVAYADFVTAMMAFFLTLWIMGLSDSTRTQVAGYFNDPMGYSKTPPLSRNIIKQPNMESPKPGESKAPGDQQATGASSIGQQLTKLEKSQNSKLKELAKNTHVYYDSSGIRIEFVETKHVVFFKLGSSELTPDAQDFVRALEPNLAKLNLDMSFEGHTDARPYSGTYDNFDLSAARALTLKNALESDGISRSKVMGVTGFGDRNLAFPNSPDDPRNRRVTIWVHAGHGGDIKSILGDPGVKESIKPDVRPEYPKVQPDAPKIGKAESSKA